MPPTDRTVQYHCKALYVTNLSEALSLPGRFRWPGGGQRYTQQQVVE
jgi:hypothetical protein